ncbi:biopolymer transporter ExbD [Altererythrobacter sp. TH136]|uniref:ExbD/TolR family protein n=1 Tax=Altererythrobacter sp. TH136 TaxID=2067415 RepID=UPI001164500A|nr:biopolymer transporter ExbD [Altererythrobacter sp. TH136]QDM41785.1 biopolymer transporter ExbD [Altererythrobacter sp. TH136]
MAMGLHAKKRGRRGRAPMAEINVTPLVDVMLVLLIIFMVTAPLLTAGVPIELPDSRANPIDQNPEQVTVSIDRDGYIFIDKERVAVGGFPDALAQLNASGGEPPVVTLRADKELDYGRVMAVMGELNRGGFNSISLVTNSSVSAP